MKRLIYLCRKGFHLVFQNVIVYFAHTAKIKSRIFKYDGSNDSSNDGNLFHAYHHHSTCHTLALQDVLKVATFSGEVDIYPLHHTIDGAWHTWQQGPTAWHA